MDWQLENLFFENEINFSRTLSVWKPKYGKLVFIEWIYMNEFVIEVMGDGGIQTNCNAV